MPGKGITVMYKNNKKIEIPEWSMLSDTGNRQVDQIVKQAKRKNLRWPDVFKELWILHNKVGFYEAMDREVCERVYKELNFNTPYYFYGITVNGKTLFDVFPELRSQH